MNRSTLRYYEKIGNLRQRTAQRVAGRATYDPLHVQTAEVHHLHQAGYFQPEANSSPSASSIPRGRAPAPLWRDLAMKKAAELEQIFFRVNEAPTPTRGVRELATQKYCQNASTI